MLAFFLILLTTAFTLLGGQLALKVKDTGHVILAFGAGAVLGTALFDLMPESLQLLGINQFNLLSLLVACGFGIYFLLNNWVSITSHKEDHECENHHHRHFSGILNVGGFSIHSIMDGLIIGLSMKASVSLGLIVAAAIIIHDISDGINTVNLVLSSGGSRERAKKWLVMDAFAPILGFVLSGLITVSNSVLGLIMALFAGFFLYISASDLVPECHHHHPKIWTSAGFVFGLSLIWFVARIF